MNHGLLVAMYIGVAVGIFVVCIILKFTKDDGKIKCKFDERQARIRGEAYKISFFTLLIYCFLYGMIAISVERQFIDSFAAMVLGCVIAIAINVVYCVLKDAYFALNERKNQLMVVFGVIGVMNIVLGIMSICEGTAIVDGVFTYRGTNLICGILFVVIWIVLFVKKIQDKRAAE